MMRTAIRAHWARIRVLITVMVSLSILFVLVHLLSGGGLFQSRAVLRTYFEDAGALQPDAAVDFNGVKVGKVASVALAHSNDPHRQVEVRMLVNRGFINQIPSDARSAIDTVNMLGDKFIQITCMDDLHVKWICQSPVSVRDGGELQHVPATNVYVRIDLTTFAAELRSIDATLKEIQEGKGSLGHFVMTDELYASLLAAVTGIQNDFHAAVSTKTPVGQLLYSPKMYEDFRASIERLDTNLAELQAGHGDMGKLLRDPAQYDQARASLADLQKSVKKAGESGFINSDELYTNWTRMLAALSRSIDDFNAGKGSGQMLASSQTYESLNGAMRELESTMKDFRSNPKKYLRLKVF